MNFTIFARNSEALNLDAEFMGIAFAGSVAEGEAWIAANKARYTEFNEWIVEPSIRRLSDD